MYTSMVEDKRRKWYLMMGRVSQSSAIKDEQCTSAILFDLFYQLQPSWRKMPFNAAVKGNRTDPMATDPPPLGCNDQTAYICKTSTFNLVLGH